VNRSVTTEPNRASLRLHPTFCNSPLQHERVASIQGPPRSGGTPLDWVANRPNFRFASNPAARGLAPISFRTPRQRGTWAYNPVGNCQAHRVAPRGSLNRLVSLPPYKARRLHGTLRRDLLDIR
jgi:hypothetical protein